MTVTVPVYNTADCLRRCLDSVLLEEALGDLELIAVNDGSTDRSAEILREYRDRYPDTLIVIDQANGGHGSAVNAGLAAANGRYFRVLDSDDWFDSPAFLRFLAFLAGRRESLIVSPYTQEYMDSGAELLYDYAFLRPGLTYAFDDIPWRRGMHYVCLPSATWRTDLLRRCGLRLFEHCRYVDMQYLFFPLPYVDTLCLFPTPVYRYSIGRSEQSVNPAVFAASAPMHRRVFCSLLDDYAERRLPVGNRRDGMALILSYMFETHAHLLCFDCADRRAAREELRELDARLHASAPEVWQLTDQTPILRLSRKLGYLDLLLSRRMLRLAEALYAKRTAPERS